MCLSSNKLLEKKIAEKDIEVVKYLRIDSKKLYSPIMTCGCCGLLYPIKEEDIIWKLDEVKTVEIGTISIDNFFITTSGLYSFSNLLNNVSTNCKPFKAIIPAGSEYYTNGVEYCSNALKIIEEVCV